MTKTAPFLADFQINSAGLTDFEALDMANKEVEGEPEDPVKLIHPKHALRMQRELRFRRGSELIYTYHGLTTSSAAAEVMVR